ncbi:MAG: hypothetical protein ABL933_08570 [Methyloglobulus sp.]|nr:hypothetical protein [Methyloglobulus sp.]
MKKIRILLTTTVLSFICANAVAIGMRSTFDVKKSIDQTIVYLEKAVAAFDKNNGDKAVINLLMEAKQVQKSISSSDGQLSMIKSKATHKLGQARSSFNDGDVKAGGEAMKEALAGFKHLKEKYNAVR